MSSHPKWSFTSSGAGFHPSSVAALTASASAGFVLERLDQLLVLRVVVGLGTGVRHDRGPPTYVFTRFAGAPLVPRALFRLARTPAVSNSGLLEQSLPEGQELGSRETAFDRAEPQVHVLYIANSSLELVDAGPADLPRIG